MWKEQIWKFIQDSGQRRLNGRVASERTKALTGQVVCAAVNRLHELGYKIQDVKNIGERHIEVLVKDAWHVKKKKIKTIQNELSRLRIFMGMLGKQGMVKSIEKYLPDVDPKLLRVSNVARQSKSWSANGIDIVQKFSEIDKRDWRLGLMLRLELAFGLRREEVLKCDTHAQDFGHYFQVFPGQGKGGRWRNIPVLSKPQRDTLDYVKSKVPKNTPLGWKVTESGKTADLKTNLRRYENLMSSLGLTKKDAGITGHGLRAQFAENHALLLGIIPPTLGGASIQLPSDEIKHKRIRLAQALGHNRPSITNAYIGSFNASSINDGIHQSLATLKYAASLMKSSSFEHVPIDRMRDCFLMQDLLTELEIQFSHEEIHHIWSSYSRRQGFDWIKPEGEIGLPLEAEAFHFIKIFSSKLEEGKA
jgi:integrase